MLEDASVNGARGVIINVTGGPDISLMEVSEASTIIQEAAHEDANIIFGAVVDPRMEGRVKITVIATGFDRKPMEQYPATTTPTPTGAAIPTRSARCAATAGPAPPGWSSRSRPARATR